MNRSELVKAVAERAGSDESAARRHVDAVFDTVMDRVSAGERVIVTGFGTFDSFARPARSARNPRTGLPVEVPAAQVPRFRTGQTFRNRVAGDAPGPAPAVEPAAAPEAEAAVTVAIEAEAPAAKKPKAGKNGKNAKDGKGAKKAKRNAEPAKPSAKAEAVASLPAKDGKNAKNAKSAKGSKKKAGKAKDRVKAGK
ncbi:HU family DNA-binding protein [Actinomadura chokoriensis]|uniref:HU family DNA-binding protein n=1 Tax=Actinomadura chokoriensis TaxID=454156 RepID=UPI0031F9E5AF